MVELELVGLSEDGTALVLADAAGEEFAVTLDERLRAVVRGDRGRPRRMETSMESAQVESALRPRDIQARIRAGESPEAVAEIAQVPVQRIMSYAVPVMAERGHIAERARRSAVRRKHAEGPGRLLGDAVAERLRAGHVDPDTCEWDAWRRDDGRWTVTAQYRDERGARTGTFVYDALSRYAVPADDQARWLVGERTEEQRQPAARSSAGRRLSPVASEYDAMLFDDDEPTAELTAVADVLRAEPEVPGQAALPGTGRPDEAAEADSARAAREASERPLDPEAPRTSDAEPAEAAKAAEAAKEAGPARSRRQQPKPEKRGRRGRGRASVPSWDEIMFGEPKG